MRYRAGEGRGGESFPVLGSVHESMLYPRTSQQQVLKLFACELFRSEEAFNLDDTQTYLQANRFRR